MLTYRAHPLHLSFQLAPCAVSGPSVNICWHAFEAAGQVAAEQTRLVQLTVARQTPSFENWLAILVVVIFIPFTAIRYRPASMSDDAAQGT